MPTEYYNISSQHDPTQIVQNSSIVCSLMEHTNQGEQQHDSSSDTASWPKSKRRAATNWCGSGGSGCIVDKRKFPIANSITVESVTFTGNWRRAFVGNTKLIVRVRTDVTVAIKDPRGLGHINILDRGIALTKSLLGCVAKVRLLYCIKGARKLGSQKLLNTREIKKGVGGTSIPVASDGAVVIGDDSVLS